MGTSIGIKSTKQFGDRTRRLFGWVQLRLVDFRKANEVVPYFKLHNFRGPAISRAHQGQGWASSNEAAIAYGCNPETMRRHSEKLDEVAISDAVMDRVHGD